MGIGTYGFVKGFTGDLRDSIDKREESERDKQKSVFLENLRRETYTWQKDIDELYSAKNPDKDMEQIDYARGVKLLKNKQGDTIREIPLTASEREEYDLTTRGKRAQTSSLESTARYADRNAESGLARDRAAIGASNASADSSRASAAMSRKALDGSAGSGGTLDERAKELLYQNKAVEDDLIRAGIPAEDVSNLAVQVLAELTARGEPSSKAQQTFLMAARALRNRGKGAAWNSKPVDPSVGIR